MTNTREEVAVTEAIHNAVARNMALDGNGKPILYNAEGVAKAAIAASNSKYVPMLVEALKTCKYTKTTWHNGKRETFWFDFYKVEKALNNLPEELRK